jgi:tetratricopeptide (TPR) repeat protein
MSDYESDLKLARELTSHHQHDDAYLLADKWLKEHPNDVQFLTLMGYIMLENDKVAIAYHLFQRCVQLAPHEAGCWLNLGQACNDLWLEKEALRAYKRGFKFAQNPRQQSMLAINMASLLIDTGKFAEAQPYCEQVLKIDPENKKGLANLGFCQLAQRQWKEGWKNYHSCVGHAWRPKTQYNDEPEWDNQEGAIAVYGEQGIGDVVSGASMVPDMVKWCKDHDSRLILDVNPNLENLFKRSFPEAKVYGTRFSDQVTWDDDDIEPAASLPIMQLGEKFRQSDKDFPGTPYLKPDPDRVTMWKALFKTKKKPTIGIAWRGGIPKTGAKYRQWDLEQLLPILRSVDAHWVSLQYKPAGKEIAAFKAKHPDIDLVEYPHATLTQDYDDTAALVAALDHCVIMQTAVGHLAGGLGIPCWTFVPKNSQWRYGSDGEDFVWAKSVRIIRQKAKGEWVDIIEKTAGELSALFAGVRKTTGKTSRDRNLRSRSKTVRANGKQGNRKSGDQPSA